MAGNLHPTLSQLVPFENVPNELEAIRDALQTIFDEIYVTNLIVGKSYQGDSGFYTMTLTTYDSLGIDLQSGTLKIVNDEEETIYHHFKVLVENTAGMLSVAENILTIFNEDYWIKI